MKVFQNVKKSADFGVSKYLRKQKFFQVRIIEATVEQYHEIGETWNDIFETASGVTMNALGIAVQKFYEKKGKLTYLHTYFEGLIPIHVAATTGDLQLLSKLEEKSPCKYPKDSAHSKTLLVRGCL